MRHVAIQDVKEDVSLVLFNSFNYESIVPRKEKEGSATAFTLPCLEHGIFVAEYIQRPYYLLACQPIHFHQFLELGVRVALDHAVEGYLLLLMELLLVAARRFCALPIR